MSLHTSLLAYRFLKANKLLNRTRWRTYDALATRGPMTGGELNHLLAKNGNPSYHRRAADLVKQGLAYVRGERACSISGYLAQEYALIYGAIDVKPLPTTTRVRMLAKDKKAAYEALVPMRNRWSRYNRKCDVAVNKLLQWLQQG